MTKKPDAARDEGKATPEDDRKAPAGNEEHEDAALEEASERMLLRKDRT